VGLEGFDPTIGEAARGLGMTARQELTRVRLPLALPVLAAGVRTAAVIGVGIATLSAFIGAGGLGLWGRFRSWEARCRISQCAG
jgi:osmoprotectant transport system permease protein